MIHSHQEQTDLANHTRWALILKAIMPFTNSGPAMQDFSATCIC